MRLSVLPSGLSHLPSVKVLSTMTLWVYNLETTGSRQESRGCKSGQRIESPGLLAICRENSTALLMGQCGAGACTTTAEDKNPFGLPLNSIPFPISHQPLAPLVFLVFSVPLSRQPSKDNKRLGRHFRVLLVVLLLRAALRITWGKQQALHVGRQQDPVQNKLFCHHKTGVVQW